MKAPGIGGALALSFFLHLVIITLAFYLGRGFYARKQAAPYFVALVSPSRTAGAAGAGKVTAPSSAHEIAAHEIEKPAEKTRLEPSAITRQKTRAETSIIKERIDALKAKQKIEDLARLRKIIDVGASLRAQTTNPSGAAPAQNKTAGGSSAGGGDYYSMVEGRIRQQWIFPEALDRDLETIVSIRIARDGSVRIEKVEKSSGNQLFDRSVLRAINLASPLPPPQKEMEIGLRFKP